MRISLFAKDADPRRDTPISRHSQFYVDDLIREKRAFMLPTKSYHRPAAMLTHARVDHHSREHRTEHGGFTDAWGKAKSGYAGPMVMQMRRLDVQVQA